jgi:hypothetical protein
MDGQNKGLFLSLLFNYSRNIQREEALLFDVDHKNNATLAIEDIVKNQTEKRSKGYIANNNTLCDLLLLKRIPTIGHCQYATSVNNVIFFKVNILCGI